VSETSTGTGRLFRSLRAEGATAEAALPALTLDEAVGLRSVTLGSLTAPPTGEPVQTPDPGRAPEPGLEYAEVAPRPTEDDLSPASVVPEVSPGDRAAGHAQPRTPGIPAVGVWLVVTGVTVVIAFADALTVGRTQLGWLTGAALLAASIYAAFVVRRDDDIVAIIAPPLAFFLATITAGQLTLPPSGSLLVREAFMIITTLGANAVWIFGATIAALVIVLLRRRRSSATTSSPLP
jgi:hypothetical protein